MFGDALDAERVRQLELVMQTQLERTRDVRRRRHLDALCIPVRCRVQPLAAGIPASRYKQSGRDDDDDNGNYDDDDDDDIDEAGQ